VIAGESHMSPHEQISASAFRTSQLPTFGSDVTYRPVAAAGADAGFTFALRACILQPQAEMAVGQMPFAAGESVKASRALSITIEVPTTEITEDEAGAIAAPVAGSNGCVTTIGGVLLLRQGDTFTIPGRFVAKSDPVTLTVRTVRHQPGKWIGVCNG
jgi:hypothetical protein